MSPQPRLNNSNVGILIAEDSPTQAEHLRYLLDENGYRVTVARSGKEALAAACQHPPSLIISDIVMPEMDGYALCREVKAQPGLKNVPVILLTSLASPDDIIRGLECGADNFIPKPYEEDYLLSHIQNTLTNFDLRKSHKTQMGVEIVFANEKYLITSDRQQILDLLLSTYETAVQKNLQLSESQKELKKLNEQLDQKVVELEAQNRLVEQANRLKSEFLANMSHELRTPLNAIIGFSQLMHDGKVGAVSSQHQEYLGDILGSARHLLQLINDVLDLSKVEAGKMEFSPEPVSLAKIIDEVRQILQTLSASKRIAVEVEVSAAVDQVIIDPAKLKQVLYNYLSNAIKFTSEKGRITLRALADGSDFFRLEVADTGIGIAADQIDKLFTEFQQLDASTAKKHQGTGLGLALTKKIVEAQGGRVGVQSMVGQGSVFYAVLPKITARKTETSAERQRIAAPATDSPNVLVVEDNEKDSQWIAKFL
jgi:two-component system sensor histidine kinase/response regulator